MGLCGHPPPVVLVHVCALVQSAEGLSKVEYRSDGVVINIYTIWIWNNWVNRRKACSTKKRKKSFSLYFYLQSLCTAQSGKVYLNWSCTFIDVDILCGNYNNLINSYDTFQEHSYKVLYNNNLKILLKIEAENNYSIYHQLRNCHMVKWVLRQDLTADRGGYWV